MYDIITYPPSASAINNTYLHILGLCGSNKYCVCLKVSIKVKRVPKFCNICDGEFKNGKNFSIILFLSQVNFIFDYPFRERLRAVFAEVVLVDVLDSGDAAHLALLQRPELGITFTKIHCWNLTQYEKCVFLDADTLVSENF